MASVDTNSLEFEGIHLTDEDFVAGTDDSSTISSGTVGEIGISEVGEDGQLGSYDAIRLGDHMDQTGMSAKGKLYITLKDDADAAVDARTQVRFLARDKNSNRRIPLTRWYSVRDLAKDDTRQRVPLQPITRNSSPMFVKDGRLLSVEVKNQAADVTVSLANSTIEVPSRGGY